MSDDMIKKMPEPEEIRNRNGIIEHAGEFFEDVRENRNLFENKKIEFIDKFIEMRSIAKKHNLKNAGTVYFITLLHFYSPNTCPIYDIFAHKALKALFIEKTPKEVFVGSAIDKSDETGVKAMYEEFVYFAESLFGNDVLIDRALDRALWIYGHMSKRYESVKLS